MQKMPRILQTFGLVIVVDNRKRAVLAFARLLDASESSRCGKFS